jgi:hypothetical protein
MVRASTAQSSFRLNRARASNNIKASKHQEYSCSFFVFQRGGVVVVVVAAVVGVVVLVGMGG